MQKLKLLIARHKNKRGNDIMKNIKWIPKKYQQHLCEVYKEGMLWNCYTKEGYIFSVTETEHVCATTQHGLLKLIKTIVKT